MASPRPKSPLAHKATPHDADVQVDLLRRENARLTSENNNLHKRLIASADAHDQHARKTTMVIRKLEQEMQDLRFLNSQYANTIQQEQRRLDEERRRVSDLLKKWQVHGASRGSSSLPSVAQRIDLPSGPLAPLDPATLLQSAPMISSPHIVDMVKLTELNATDQRNRADDAEVRIHELELYVKELKNQVSTREAEIQRLSSLMESDRQPDGSTRREHLETQIDYLQQALREAETQLHLATSRSSAELKAAQDKNARLIENLRDLQQQLESLQSSLHDQSTMGALQDEVESLQELLKTARFENQHLQDRINDMELSNQQLKEQENDAGTGHNQQEQPAGDNRSSTLHPEPLTSSSAVPVDTTPPRTTPESHPALPSSHSHSTSDCFDQSHQNLLAELQQERSARASLLEELRHLDSMTQSLTQQVERVLEERDNFESLYLQLVEKGPGDATVVSTTTEPRQPAHCASCAFLQSELQVRSNELKQARTEVEGAVSRVQELEDQASRTRVEHQRFEDLQQRNTALQEAHMELTRSLGEQMRIIQKLNDDLGHARANMKSSERVTQVEAENQALRENLARAQAISTSSNAALNQRMAEVSQLHRRTQELEMENKSLSIEVGNIAADLSSLIKENQRLCNDIEQSRKATVSLESVVTNLQQALQQHRDLLRRCDHDKQNLIVNYKKLATQHNARGDALTALQVVVSQLRQEVRLKDARIAGFSSAQKSAGYVKEPQLAATTDGPTRSSLEPKPVHPIDPKPGQMETPRQQEVDGSLTREWLSIQREVAEDPSVLRRKRALEAAGT